MPQTLFMAVFRKLLLLIVFCAGNVSAQQVRYDLSFENITINEGLPHNTVQKIFEDSNGYIWFATKDGLCRYDGSAYVVYRESLTGGSLSNSKIRCISEDNAGGIWAGTDNGLNRIDPVSGRVHSFLSGSWPGLKNNKINELYYDSSRDYLWIATESGVALYDASRKEFIVIGKDRFFDEPVNTIGMYSPGEIYIGTRTGLYIYDIDKKTVRRIEQETGKGDFNVFAVLRDSNGNTWVGSNIALLGKIEKGRNTISFPDCGPEQFNDDLTIYSIAEQDSILWLVSKRRGILLYNKNRNKIEGTSEHYSVNPTGSGDKEKIKLTSVYKDHSGTIWIGSYYMGLFFYSKYLNRFNHILIPRNRKTSTGIIGPIVPDGRGLWLGSDDTGITYYNTKSGTQQYYDIYGSGSPLTECNPLFIQSDMLWIGTDSYGIQLFDLKKRRVTEQYTSTSTRGKLPSNKINCALKDSKGRIWVGFNGGTGGICRFDPSETNFTVHLPSTPRHAVKDVYFIYEAADDELWLGTRSNGLFRYDVTKDLFTPIPIMNREDLSISYIFKDSGGRIWVGTFGQGLICMEYSGEISRIFDNGNSKINNNICGIVEDNGGRIWVSSFYEISYYDDKSGTFIKYDTRNNFPILHVKPMSCHFSKDNLLYFGGSNGLAEIDPRNLIRIDTCTPKVVLTDFLIHNQSADTLARENALRHHMVKLNHNQDNLTLVFAALNYIYPQKNLYRYKLEGASKEWSAAETQKQVTFSNLAAGEYRFLVQACNSSGIWSEPANLLTVIIRPAPWFSWWAYLVYGAAILSLLFVFLYYLRIKMKLEHDLELKNIEKKNLDRMHKFRIDLFTNFSHEIRTPLTLISGPLDDLLEQPGLAGSSMRNTFQGIRQNTNKIMKLVNQLMDFRKHDEGRMELRASEQELFPFIRDIVLMFGELSKIQNHPLEVSLPDEEPKLWYNPQLLEKVFSNVLMNAFKYSRSGSTIVLNAAITDMDSGPYRDKTDRQIAQAVLVSVFSESHNIPGDELEKIFEPFYRLENTHNEESSGIGLSHNRMIMRLHHGDIWAENIEGKGIVFKFLIPMGKEHLGEEELSKSPLGEYPLPCAAPTAGKPCLPVRHPDSGKGIRTLLIVEDNDEIRCYLKNKLALWYNILDCKNGSEALSILRKKDVCLVISDVMMPVMDGIELCKAIKDNLETNHIPVILLTARISDTHIKDGLLSGADDYVTKPFKFDLLLARIRNLLANNDRLRQSFQKRISPQDMNVKVTDHDEKFLKKCYDYLRENLTDPDLTIEDFGKEVGLSRVHLYRKLKYLTGTSPSRFILKVRLTVAADLLLQEGVAVSDVCYRVGFNDLSYFTRCFKANYNVSPSEYRSTR